MHLVAIDDDGLFLQLLEGAAEAAGFESTVTYDADKFFRAVEGNLPDIVVVDLVMPDHDGIEILQQLADRSVTAKVLLISSSEVGIVERVTSLAAAWGLNVAGYLTKPVSIDGVQERLEEIKATLHG